MSYLSTVEEAYTSLRQSGLCLSPADRAQVQQWERQGIPLDALVRALAEGLQRYRAAHGFTRRAPSLRWFRAVVEEQAHALGERSVGAPAPESAGSWLEAELAALAERLEQVAHVAPARVLERARAAIEAAAGGGWTFLETARAHVAAARAAALPADERRALGQDLRSAVGPRPSGVTPAAHRDTLRALLAQWI